MYIRKPAQVALICILWLTAAPASAASWLDNFSREPGFGSEAAEIDFRTILVLVDNEDLPAAREAMQDFASRYEQILSKEAPLAWSQTLTNLALLEAAGGEYDSALAALERGISGLESARSPFSPSLIDPLLARSKVLAILERWDDAEDDLRRAQHIIHRQRGVYSPEQLPVVEDIAKLNEIRGEWIDADLQHVFRLKIGERNWGRQSEQLIPLLHELGDYFAQRGYDIPRLWNENADMVTYRDELFRSSIDLYERAIEIIEQKYGENDVRLLESLRGLAETRILQQTGRYAAEDAMERAVEIVRMNPGTDLPDYVRTLVELGDIYNITRDGRAEETYLEAWNLIADKPEYDDLRRELFGRPKRLLPIEARALVIDRYPDGLDESDELYIDAEYTVHASGKVTDVDIVAGNVANQEKRTFRNILGGRYYRPRIVDGQLVDTEGMMLHQTFIVLEREPETEVSFEVGPEYGSPTPRPLHR